MLAQSPSAEALRAPALWASLLEDAVSDRRRPRRIGAYRQLIASGVIEDMVAAYAAGRLVPSPPVRHHVNKHDGRQKVVFTFAPADELMFKAVNRVLQPLVEAALSRLCHSFRPGRGPRSAYGEIMRIPSVDRLASLHVDVRDYFNSIPVDQLLETLPEELRGDHMLMRLLSEALHDRRVLVDGVLAEEPHKGVMAGTPLAPLLSDLYLRPLDRLFEDTRVPYVRYADDILVLGEPAAIDRAREVIESKLAALGLELNSRKTRSGAPGEPWEFLGFRFEAGVLDVAPRTAAKLRRRARRIARRVAGRPQAAAYCVRRLNRRLYGVGGRRQDFSWAAWFFPLLGRTATLAQLDRVIQGHLRFAATGAHSRRNLGEVPYSVLLASGYVPLVSAYHAFRTSPSAYRRLVDRRAGRC